MSSKKPPAIPLPVLAISLGLPLILCAAVGVVRLSLGEGEQYAGIFRYDLFYYLANAREVLESGNGLFYDNPFSASFDGPRVYSHLQLVLFGWLWWLFGIPLPLLWEVGQVLFGFGMFVMLWLLLGSYFEGRERLAAFVLLAVGGGGLALQSMLFSTTSSGSPSVVDVFRFFTADTKGPAWLPNIFQNALYTTEAWYHFLSLGTLACVAGGKRGLAFAGVLLTWWSHPFTGLELGAIVGAAALLEAIVHRDAKTVGFAASVALVSGLFLLYYIILIPHFSIEAAYILEHWRVDITIFHLREAWAMWGFFLLGPLFLLRPNLGIVDLRGNASDRLLIAWLCVVLALVFHDRLLPPGIDAFQPLHFTRGYLFLPMGILLFRALSKWSAQWPTRRRRVALAVLISVASLDNVVYTLELSDPGDRPVLNGELLAIADFLAGETPPTNLIVDGKVPLLAGYLPIVTPHRVYLAHPYLTPFFAEKSAAVGRMMMSDSPARGSAQLGIGYIVGKAVLEEAFAKDIAVGRARLAFSVGPYRVIEILLPKLPQQPGAPPDRFVDPQERPIPTQLGCRRASR